MNVLNFSLGCFVSLIFFQKAHSQLIITELMADPTPSQGLPEVEYVELYNKADTIVHLQDFSISDRTKTVSLPNLILQPHSYLVLAKDTTGLLNSAYINLPSLNNSGDKISILLNGRTIDSVEYGLSFYKDKTKEDGGYALERISFGPVCSTIENWTAALTNGSPGVQNSVFSDEQDLKAPKILTIEFPEPGVLLLGFDEAPIVSNLSSTADSLLLTDTKMTLFSSNFEVQISGYIEDCLLNSNALDTLIVLPHFLKPGQLVLNELLFDPSTGGSDFIEVYNGSEHLLNLRGLEVWNNDEQPDQELIFEKDFLMPSNSYLVLGADAHFIANQFPRTSLGSLYETDLPAFRNDSGTVILKYKGAILDSFHYEPNMHFELLEDTENVTLEKIRSIPLNNTNNWFSAGSAHNYGTPGYQNSQHFYPNIEQQFSVEPKVFSPDSDGFEDFTSINYNLNEKGNVGTIKIYDLQGRIIKEICNHDLLGYKGHYIWNGLTDGGEKAPFGYYIVGIELKQQNGGNLFVKKTVILGSNFN